MSVTLSTTLEKHDLLSSVDMNERAAATTRKLEVLLNYAALLKKRQELASLLPLDTYLPDSVNRWADLWEVPISALAADVFCVSAFDQLSPTFSNAIVDPHTGQWRVKPSSTLKAIPTYTDSMGTSQPFPGINVLVGPSKTNTTTILERTHPFYACMDSNPTTIGLVSTPYGGRHVWAYIPFDPSMTTGVNRVEVLTLPGTEVLEIQLKKPNGNLRVVPVDSKWDGVTLLSSSVPSIGMYVKLQSVFGVASVRSLGAYYDEVIGDGTITFTWGCGTTGHKLDTLDSINTLYSGIASNVNVSIYDTSPLKNLIYNSDEGGLEASPSGVTIGETTVSVVITLSARTGQSSAVKGLLLQASIATV